MSVLIKGMKMPISCWACPMSHPQFNGMETVLFCELLVKEAEEDDGRLKNCPIIEVPPHGRLIDADQIINAIYHDYEEGGATVEAKPIDELLSEMCNETVPTIIEAEGEL